ncbi:hypothetical protein [Mangrovimonas sp. TPBH4]|uniref:hypothetical protein n=1 Tax=Mangrovimonas sp. TPBH4 TaxID=1645914 RepID=UPI0006B64FCC|nr:hypothetical protein [Mangrovimonas sp. TPBH4]
MKPLFTLSFFLCLFFTTDCFAQDPYLTITSKDSINGAPKFKSSMGVHMKLNGYLDLFGGLQGNDTFNIGYIDVFGDDDETSLNVDMYQTQIRWSTFIVMPDGQKIKAIVESDFWGGNGHVRLRKAYVESKHWQIGQNWNNFGDEDLWPNIMELEGPPSGIWLRNPHIKYMNTFNDEKWKYEISLEAPQDDYFTLQEIQPFLDDTHQSTPDVTFAMTYQKVWGHLRLASILRNIKYKLNDEVDNFFGYGVTFSGKHTVDRNCFQFQLVGGKGISYYLTTISGFGYDGYPAVGNDFKGTLAFGGWVTYEYFFNEKLHGNAVFGYTRYSTNDSERYVIIDETEAELDYIAGDFRHRHYYGILNLMYDAYDRMTLGLEVDYGVKSVKFDGNIDGFYFDETFKRDAMRISFGFMFDL